VSSDVSTVAADVPDHVDTPDGTADDVGGEELSNHDVVTKDVSKDVVSTEDSATEDVD
jgi:hypothetical protein